MRLVERSVVARWAVMLLVIAMVTGCNETVTRATLLAEAKGNYAYGPERAPVPDNNPRLNQPGGGMLPGMTIATATRTSDRERHPSNRFLARVTVTGGPYLRMGFAPGANYVWRDSGGGRSTGWLPARGAVALARISFLSPGLAHDPARTLIVPEDPTYPMRWLQHEADHTPLSTSSPDLPRLVMSTSSYGMCDNGCSGGHCVAFQASAGDVTDPVPTVITSP